MQSKIDKANDIIRRNYAYVREDNDIIEYQVGHYHIHVDYVGETIWIYSSKDEREVSINWVLKRLDKKRAQPILENIELFQSLGLKGSKKMEDLYEVLENSNIKSNLPLKEDDIFVKYHFGDYDMWMLKGVYSIQKRDVKPGLSRKGQATLEEFITDIAAKDAKFVIFHMDLFKKYAIQ